jgi:site-specific DNA recombinase
LRHKGPRPSPREKTLRENDLAKWIAQFRPLSPIADDTVLVLEDEIVSRQAEASEARVALTKKLAALADERQKLLRAYYANAIPLELLKVDQDRITKQEAAAKAELEHTEADLEGWQEVLSLAIRLAGNCHAAYLKANPKVRRRFNDAVLESVYIEDGKVSRAEFTEVFEALFSRLSSNKALSVDPIGIEPTTSTMPW